MASVLPAARAENKLTEERARAGKAAAASSTTQGPTLAMGDRLRHDNFPRIKRHLSATTEIASSARDLAQGGEH